MPKIDEKRPSTVQQQKELDDALAALIVNTKRVNRKLNLIEIAAKLEIAQKYLSIKELAARLSLSSEMLREFSRVSSLVAPVKKILEKNMITSIDIADRLSRLPKGDQFFVARQAANGTISSEDLRAIVAQRKMMPRAKIADIVSRILSSKNIRIYVLEFQLPPKASLDGHLVLSRVNNFFGEQHVRNIEQTSLGTIQVTIDEVGKNRLIRAAKESKLSKRGMLKAIILEGTQSNA